MSYIAKSELTQFEAEFLVDLLGEQINSIDVVRRHLEKHPEVYKEATDRIDTMQAIKRKLELNFNLTR